MELPFQPPSFTADLNSMEEGLLLRDQLIADIEAINSQLGDRQRTNEFGERLSTSDYWAWKRKAQKARNLKLRQLREVKAWLQHKKDESASFHLSEMLKILSTAKEDGVEFSTDELKRIDEARSVAALTHL